ncbi:MAG: DUF4132 domain-containing protein [Bradymonadaceae bacterium]|nr:DUF4132 domain-containing protein [Lujinxingiaceae bacterium]
MAVEAIQPWVDADGGYAVTIDEGKIVCRNAKGKLLATLPPKVRSSDAVQQLRQVLDLLVEHERTCIETVDGWMLRSLPVPVQVILAVWDDPAWRKPLENAVVAPQGFAAGDEEHVGFLRGADAQRGVGLVNLDGETIWLNVETVVIPHPVLLAEIADLREIAVELAMEQGLSQLFREIYPRGAEHKDDQRSIQSFANGKFDQLNFANGRCRSLGYRVRGGFACCPVWEAGVHVEARYWIGCDYPEYETFTGELIWVDDKERPLALGSVGPVAFSEGMRMAAAVYAGRAKEEKTEE